MAAVEHKISWTIEVIVYFWRNFRDFVIILELVLWCLVLTESARCATGCATGCATSQLQAFKLLNIGPL